MPIISPYTHNHHSKKINTELNLTTFSIVFTNKNRGAHSAPPPIIFRKFYEFNSKTFYILNFQIFVLHGKIYPK